MTWLFCFITACNQENSFYNRTLAWFNNDKTNDTIYIKKPDNILKENYELQYRFQLVNDTSFFYQKDTISFELYKDIQMPSDYYLNCFKNHVYSYSLVITPRLFSDRIDSSLLQVTQISEPEILYFSAKYQKLFLWFNLGFSNQHAYNKGLLAINEKGKNWFKDIVTNDGFGKYQYCTTNDKENIILGNYVIQLETEKIKKIERPFIFSGFLNSQSYFIVDDPVRGDTFIEDKRIDEWGNEKIDFYRVTQKDTVNKNLIVFNLNGDTLYKIRFDGICEDEAFGKLVSFGKSDALKIGVFYDFQRKFIRIFDLETLNQKIIPLKELISDYPENLPFIDIPVGCYFQDSILYPRGERILRLFFQNQKPTYYLFLHSRD